MSMQKMISDIEMERAHNRVLGETFSARLAAIKDRHAEELDALAQEFRGEIAARDAALAQLVTGEPVVTAPMAGELADA